MRIAIIGGGASGALTALHLARALPVGSAKIIVIEPAEEIGRGLAYSTDDPGHLLNVRAVNMSAFADQPDHLFQWLRTKGSCGAGLTPLCFIPRSMYGAYIADIARELTAAGGMRHVRERCVDLVEIGNSVVLALETGSIVVADIAILAIGNNGTPVLDGIPAVQPWAEDALKNLSADLPVLLIGTGLTMVDMAISLDRQGHRGKITALSPRGLLSLVHRNVKPIVVPANDVPFGTELSKMSSWIRQLCTRVVSQGCDWRSAIDALRPHTQRIWRSMSLAQRQRFARHARAYWDVHRHRLAPEVQTQLSSLRAAGRLEIIAGRIVDAEQRKDAITVKIVRRGQNEIETCGFARLVDCTGPIHDPRQSTNPLIRSLLARGAARPDPLSIGLDIDEEYSLIDASSRRSNRVRAIGPLTRAAFWECIAIPDIRVQCGDLAGLIARTPPSGARDVRGTAASASVSQQTSQSSREEHPMALTLGGYDRIIRHRGNGIEAVEIVWHPGTRTPKHNHGSRGWAWVLKGRVFEVRNGKKLYHAAGDAFLEVDREEAHIVGNDTNELAITFHVYQPELQMDMFSDSESDIVAMDLCDISEPNHFAPFSTTQLSPREARND